MDRPLRRTVLTLAVALCFSAPVATGGAAAASRQARAASCSARGLSAGPAGSSVRVVTLQASGLSCAAARTVARRVATDLLHGATLSFPRASGLSISEQTCSGCSSKTEVAISYPQGGTLSVTLTRAPAAGSGGPVVTA